MDLTAPRDLLRDARRIAVLTGAGISAESGIPTFRAAGGYWRTSRAEDLATPEGFARDPKLVWEWYDERRTHIAQAEPNPGHYALVELEKRAPVFTLITQNVDGLHERAGSRSVLRLHGSIWHVRCLQCNIETEDRRAKIDGLPPRCACGGMLRPGVVWFGECLPEDVWFAAESAAGKADVLIVAGTSAAVYPAAGLAATARRRGVKIIEVNVEDTPLTGEVDYALRGPSGVVLPELIDGL